MVNVPCVVFDYLLPLSGFPWHDFIKMLILLVAIACLRSLGSSAPIPHGEPLQSGPLPVQNYRMRTRFDIAWSCASTIFICTWVAIHPNVPPREKSRIRSLWRSFWIRTKLMLCTLVVPELVLIWAFRQWAAARYIAMLFQGEYGVCAWYYTRSLQ